jgi:hypothetical protein
MFPRRHPRSPLNEVNLLKIAHSSKGKTLRRVSQNLDHGLAKATDQHN